MVSSSAVPIFSFSLAGYGCLCHYYYLLFRATFASIILEGVGGFGDSFSLSLYCNEGSGSRVPMVGGEGGVWKVDLWRGITMAYRSLA